MTKDTGIKKTRNSLIKNENHKLLQVKEILEKLITEASPLPPAVKQDIESAKDAAWAAFVAEQTKNMNVQ